MDNGSGHRADIVSKYRQVKLFALSRVRHSHHGTGRVDTDMTSRFVLYHKWQHMQHTAAGFPAFLRERMTP